MYTKYDQWLNEAKLESFNTKEEIEAWLDLMGIKNYTINEDLTVDVKGNVQLSRKGLTSIPVQFGTIAGDFKCPYNKITSLQGSPKEVKGDFYCAFNKLANLDGCPKEVKGNFFCNDNKLTSLEGSPKEVGGGFDCVGNDLTSLQGGPNKVGVDFYCSENKTMFTEEDVKEFSKVKGTIKV